MPQVKKIYGEQLHLIDLPSNGAKPSKKERPPLTTAQRLGSIIKSARDIMRKDKGLNGDLDRLPMLTWIMFLKFLDDNEGLRREEAARDNRPYQEAIEAPYRWHDWAANPSGITGDALKAFINRDEIKLTDDTSIPGLFAYLRTLQPSEGAELRGIIANVFRGVNNRMESGNLLRDVINKINQIHFTSSDEIHTLGHLYETLLKEMRDAAGDSGEFYTPRAVVRFMVEALNPRLGEAVLDPACGTGGFLTEAFEHLKKQYNTVEYHTIEYREVLQKQSIFGGEAKTLPYLLAQMNLLLHGLEWPQIMFGNSLTTPLKEIGDAQRFDIILTNPPFGGEEEASIQDNFPVTKRTSETALLFLQLIMHKLRCQPKPGRASVVVPNGILFAGGVAARVKEDLLKNFNLHTIVRLPTGVFAPYTSIPTNLLFFDRSGPTHEVWYYEQLLPSGRKNYTKTQPIQFEDFADCLHTWWHNRNENERAWRVSATDILANGCDLDIKNPYSRQALELLPPEELLESILQKEQRITQLMIEVKEMLSREQK